MNYLFSERQNFTVLHVPSLSKTKICDICGSYECALKGVNSFCSKNLIDLSPSLLPSSATRAFLSYQKCGVSIINLLITFLCYLIHKWNINLSWYILIFDILDVMQNTYHFFLWVSIILSNFQILENDFESKQ